MVTLQQFLPKQTTQTIYVKSDKIYISILQDLPVNSENKMVKFSYKN